MDNINELHIKIIKCSKLKARRPGKHGRNRTSFQWVDNEMEETGCEVICWAPTTLVVMGEMILMMMMRQ